LWERVPRWRGWVWARCRSLDRQPRFGVPTSFLIRYGQEMVAVTRKIIHVDMDAFFASVE
jgi:hypothetical protein